MLFIFKEYHPDPYGCFGFKPLKAVLEVMWKGHNGRGGFQMVNSYNGIPALSKTAPAIYNSKTSRLQYCLLYHYSVDLKRSQVKKVILWGWV